MSNPSIALLHEWLTTIGGSDQVAARLGALLGVDRVFTYAAWSSSAATLFPAIEVTVVGPQLDLVARNWQWFLPHMPLAWRSVDLTGFDVVVTSSHSCVNSVRPRADALLISYCHTPMRYAWEWRSEAKRLSPWLRPAVPPAAAVMRAADRRWAQRVDLFLANSRFVAGRIARFYGKPSLVVYPPVDTAYWTRDPDAQREDYFLLSGRLVAYKRPDLVVAAASASGSRLVVAGGGPMFDELRRIAGPGTTFVQDPSRERLRDLYRRAKGYVFGGIEDFGMSIVEAQACGTPVLATAAGGALETVVPGVSGVLLESPTVSDFGEAMKLFRPEHYDPEAIRAGALRFGVEGFDHRVSWAVEKALARGWSELKSDPGWVEASGALLR